MSDPEIDKGSNTIWREHVDDTLTMLNDGQEQLARAQEENTLVTLSIQKDLAEHREKTAPIVDAIETMHDGVAVLGKIGTFMGSAGKFIGKCVKISAPIIGGLATAWLAFKDESTQILKWLHSFWPFK